jgi:uncharacterized protein (TIGR02118 family)
MTVKVVVLYTQPDDAATFDQHYLDVHMPMVAKIPGLLRSETATFIAAGDGGELTYHRTAELYFEDMAALGAGMGSPEGAATGEDYAAIAPLGSRILIAQVD